MATSKEIKGVSAKRKKPLVIPQPYTPQNQWISKSQFLKNRAALKAANLAGEEARKRVLAEHGVTPQEQVEAKPTAGQVKLEKLRKALAEAEKKLQGNPGSKAFAKKVKELSEDLEVLESEGTE